MNGVFIKNARIYQRRAFFRGNLRAENGVIVALGPDAENQGFPEIDANGQMLLPGFIDAHTHGGAGFDVNGSDAAGLREIGKFFAKQGVTGWLASVMTDTEEKMLWCLAQIREAMEKPGDGARLLGAHLEGPFLSVKYKGAMPESLLRQGSAALFERFQNASGGAIRYITVAPEVPGVLDMVRAISDTVAVSLGHSGASYEEAMECVRAGARSVTHTFNAMGLFHQHRPGLMGAALESDLYCEAIADGRHLHPGAIRMLLKAKSPARVVAVTDSIMAAGLPDGQYALGVNEIIVRDGDATLKDGTRAGSTLTMLTALRNMLHFTGLPLEELIPLLTESPASMLRLQQLGTLQKGQIADMLLMDDAFALRRVFVGGKEIWREEN